MLGEDLSARQARGSPTRTHPEQSSAPGGDTAGPGVEGRAPQDAGVEPLEGCTTLISDIWSARLWEDEFLLF